MKDYKICVYAICKNEEKFVDRFMDCLEEVKDHIYILDTGSTDNTVEKFKNRGAHVKQKKYPKFEFDKARNDSLKLVPKDYDICICLDIDDCIEPGFINKIKAKWKDDTTQLRYYYYYSLDDHDKPLIKFLCGKIHKRDAYHWKYPIHEVLESSVKEINEIDAPEIVVKHRPDFEKSREFYLGLLEEYVDNNPDDTRNTFLLAREYKNRGQWKKCIELSHTYLNKNHATYKPERVQVMSFMAMAYRSLEYYEESELWGLKALKEYKCRTPYVELMMTSYNQHKYQETIDYGLKALKIKKRDRYVTEDVKCWDGTIYDYVSLGYFYLKDYDNAIKYLDLNIKQNPNLEQLKENRKIFVEEKKKSIN